MKSLGYHFTCAAVFFSWTAALAQQKACELIPNYAKWESELHKKYLENIQVKIEENGYDKIDRTGKLEGTAVRTTTFGVGKMRRNSVVKHPGEKTETVAGAMYSFDELYTLEKQGSSYIISEHKFDGKNITDVETSLINSGAFLPLTCNGWMRLRAIDGLNSYLAERNKGPAEEFQSLQESSYGNRPAVVLVSKNPFGAVSKNYYDPANSYALLGYEIDQTLDPRTRKYSATKVVGTITYEPSDLGYPVPRKYVSNFVTKDGKVIPRLEITFLEWKKYTPTEDDFDLEKQFGVKPLPRPADAGPSPIGTGSGPAGRGIGRWLWIGVGVLAAITVGLGVVVWRRRRNTVAG